MPSVIIAVHQYKCGKVIRQVHDNNPFCLLGDYADDVRYVEAKTMQWLSTAYKVAEVEVEAMNLQEDSEKKSKLDSLTQNEIDKINEVADQRLTSHLYNDNWRNSKWVSGKASSVLVHLLREIEYLPDRLDRDALIARLARRCGWACHAGTRDYVLFVANQLGYRDLFLGNVTFALKARDSEKRRNTIQLRKSSAKNCQDTQESPIPKHLA
ncbi:hypothetical protein BJ170DRAFT_726674 [Xylariales sp. AK1849]|nr:hypothetical protein BJ170DRAFT_726674 [Xylariales sp. AK1849]